MTKINFKKHLADGFLIVFSVLFALTINKIAENYQTNERKETALASIKKELTENSEIIKKWKKSHTDIYNRIDSIVNNQNDSLRNELLKYNFLNLGVLTNNESLVNEIITNTAWETSKSTGIIAEFDFETTKKLTFVYATQAVLTEGTLIKTLDFYFDLEAHKMENLDAILLQFLLRFNELKGQEYLLGHLYSEALKEIERSN